MCTKWLVIGISGVTCGGKTTLANDLNKILPGSLVISQDDYFLDVEDERHVWIPELNHINFDVLTSLDMRRMHEDVATLLADAEKHRPSETKGVATPRAASVDDVQKLAAETVKRKGVKVLILEGFCIFNHPPIAELCDAKYYFQLNYEECEKRRSKRVYEPPDCSGYFEKCVWPEYLLQLKEVRDTVKGVTYFDEHSEEPLKTVLIDIIRQVL